MSATTSLLSAALVVAQRTPDPEDVKAGWLGLLVFLALAAAVVFLWFSLRKHLGRVKFDETADPADTADHLGDAPRTEDPSNGTAPGAPRRPQA